MSADCEGSALVIRQAQHAFQHDALNRSRNGRLPACLEACPTGARVFGNLLDPDSNIRWVLANKRVFVLKEDVGTEPRFYYFFDK